MRSIYGKKQLRGAHIELWCDKPSIIGGDCECESSF